MACLATKERQIVRSHICRVCRETTTVKFDAKSDAQEYDALLRTCALALCKNRECIVLAMKTAINVMRDLRRAGYSRLSRMTLTRGSVLTGMIRAGICA